MFWITLNSVFIIVFLVLSNAMGLTSLSDIDSESLGRLEHSVWSAETLAEGVVLAEDGTHHHSISKRQASNAAFSFVLEKTGYNAAATNVKIGDWIGHKLTISVTGTGTMELTVEIYGARTDHNGGTWTILSICNPTVTTSGANIVDFVDANIVGVMSDTTGDKRYDKAVVYFGEFTHVEDSLDDVDDQIVLAFDVLVNYSPGFTEGTAYTVTVAADYETGTWTGSETFYGITSGVTLTSGTEPSFSLTGPDTLMKGNSGLWTLSMTLRDAAHDVIIDVYSPLNQTDIVSICRVSIGNRGSSYTCYPGDEGASLSFEDDNMNHVVASLDLGEVVNSKFWEGGSTNADDTIEVEINVKLLNTSEVIAEIEYYIGVSIEIDSSTLWSAQDTFQALESETYEGDNFPTIKLAGAHQTVVWGVPTTFYLNITIPAGQSDSYYLEASLPTDGTALMTTSDFGVRAYYVGHNFPCFTGLGEIIREALATGAAEGEFDYIRLDLGQISNTGYLDTDDDNTIVLEFRALVVDSHENITSGENLTTYVGLKLGGPTAWVGRLAMTVQDLPEMPSSEPEIKHYSAMNARDAAILYEGGSTAEIIAIRIPPSSILKDFNITVRSSEIDGSPALHFCKLDVLQYGSLIHEEWSNGRIGKTWTNSTKRVAKTDVMATNEITLVLDWVVNGGYGNYWWNVNETTVYVIVNVLATSHPDLADGDSVTFDVILDYGGASAVTDTVTLTYETTSPTSAEGDDAPEVNLLANEMNEAPVGGVVSRDLEIYTTPRTITNFKVEAATEDGSPLSVCRIAVKEAGDTVSCITDDYRHGVTYESYNGIEICTAEDESNGLCYTSLYGSGSFELGNVANYGQVARNGSNDAASLIHVTIDVLFHENMSEGVNAGDTSNYTIGVFIGDSQLFLGTATISLNPNGVPAPSTDSPEFTFEKYNAESSISRGAGALFIVKGYTPPGSTSYYAEIFSPLNTTEDGSKAALGDVTITTAGWNLPCLNDKHIDVQYLSTGNDDLLYDTATVQLSNLVNIAQDSIPVIHEDNMFSMEIVVCVPEDSPATDGETLEVSAGIIVGENAQNATEIWVQSIDYTISDDLLPGETSGYVGLAFAESYTTPTLQFGEEIVRTIHLSTIMLTSDLGIEFEMPTDGTSEALLTIRNVHISGVGSNFPCDQDRDGVELEVDSHRTFGTTQDDYVEAIIGRLTNVGTSLRYQFDHYSPTDDAIQITYTVVPSQHVDNTGGVTKEYNVFLSRDGETRLDTNLTDSVSIDSASYTPTPDLQIFATIDESVPYTNRTPGEIVSIYIRFNHTATSSGHAYDAELRIFAPDYLRYEAHEGMDLIDHTSTTSVTADENSLLLEMGEIYFTDNETLTVNYTIDPTGSIELGQDIHVVIPASLVFYGHSADETAISDAIDTMVILEFDVHVPECTDALGLESGAIADCQITWSSAQDGYDGTGARLNSGTAWKTPYRGEPFMGEEYLQISFGNMTRVTGLTVQPPHGTTDWVEEFKLQYSMHEDHWFTLQDSVTNSDKLFDISDSVTATPDDVIFVPLVGAEVIQARAIRFLPQSDSNAVSGVRLEVYGCPISSEVAAEACSAASSPGLRSVYERGWLMDVDEGHLYVCILSEIDDYVSCSHTSDFGISWEPINEKIVNINFLRSDTKQLYGLARNQLSLMRSDDWGENWCSVTESEYTNAESSAQVIRVARLPFEDWSQTTLNDLNVEFGFDFNSSIRWTVSMDGVNKWEGSSWTLISYWSTEEWTFVP